MTELTPFPRLKHTFLLFLLFVAFSLLVSMPVSIIGLLNPKYANLAQNSWVLLVLYCLPLIFTIWIGYAFKKQREGQFHWQFKEIPGLLYIAIPLVTLAIYFILDPLVELIPMPDFFIRMMEQLLGKQDFASFLMIVIAAAILEELLCRGLFLDGLLQIYSPKKAIIWSAVLFGLLHLNPWQFVPAFFLGLFMGWLFYKTGSLLTTITVHATANGFGYFIGFFLPEDALTATARDLIGNNVLYISLLVLSILIIWFGTRWISAYIKKASS